MAADSRNVRGEEAPLGKVELDLEGAPFLEPEPEDIPEESTAEATTAEVVEAEVPKKSRKKLYIIAGILLVFLLAGIGGFYLFVLRGAESEPRAVNNAPVGEPAPVTVVVPSSPPPIEQAPVEKFRISMAPFWVETSDPEGEIRFAYYELVLITDNQRIAFQLEKKNTIIRDAVYYYLKNKPYSFLADSKELGTLKKDLLNIINQYLVAESVVVRNPEMEKAAQQLPKEKLQEVLIVDFLIK